MGNICCIGMCLVSEYHVVRSGDNADDVVVVVVVDVVVVGDADKVCSASFMVTSVELIVSDDMTTTSVSVWVLLNEFDFWNRLLLLLLLLRRLLRLLVVLKLMFLEEYHG